MENLNIHIRPFEQNEAIPYELLLLADPSKKMVDEYINDSLIYLAINENVITGVYALLPLNNHVAEIKNIAVHNVHQGKGIGKLLLESAIQVAKEKGFESLLIGTANSSVTQLYLYQKCGFEIVEIRKNFFLDNYNEPIFENGIQCKHMIVLIKNLNAKDE
ncbi:GNAT family N-acetyltransferase [Solitalea canadensis]|uniref:Acetyltransferase n=1 Tax=Solitalea canadensis (strain ATCC 29591 / DSM 3403 / JCM 21819 / LMG 8368 / NBRC 15130 / NCIMB 12057 / USAM 9D) TaxID=929556 RepID=H8KU71_SOLCM|nr:GNAT family N-acetyltransferase [Solitalea canadensis]AFD07183.1 acetyltransferase [Solitalea canadensis DSM 3403]